MALHDTGERTNDLTGIRARAKDEDDHYVMVWTSDEAITDYGWDVIWAVADKKYANKDYDESDDGVRTVRVTTNDCANA